MGHMILVSLLVSWGHVLTNCNSKQITITLEKTWLENFIPYKRLRMRNISFSSVLFLIRSKSDFIIFIETQGDPSLLSSIILTILLGLVSESGGYPFWHSFHYSSRSTILFTFLFRHIFFWLCFWSKCKQQLGYIRYSMGNRSPCYGS